MYLLHNVWYLYGYIEIIKAHKKPVISYHQTQIWYDSKVVFSYQYMAYCRCCDI